MPASTPLTIDATAAHVDTTIALPCFKPRVYWKERRFTHSDKYNEITRTLWRFTTENIQAQKILKKDFHIDPISNKSTKKGKAIIFVIR